MSETSSNLTLPFIQPAQAQKHVTHNEAVELLDVIVQLTLQGIATDTPPASPTEGQSWHIGVTPTGDWAGQAGKIASWAGGGWFYLTPQTGWQAYDESNATIHVFNGSSWQGVSAQTLHLAPRLAPVNATAGDLYFDSATNKARCFDGTSWHDLF